MNTPWAHPRRCGEHDPQGGCLQGRCGLIPAGAGNMPCGEGERASYWAHPRRCGEHGGVLGEWARSLGSSPQVRGTYVEVGNDRVTRGLIPAGAGNMSPRRLCAACGRAHPRRCGEHDLPGYRPVDGHGLIPAGAGNIGSGVLAGSECGAHPRRCGEHATTTPMTFPLRGSSPQVRGTSELVGTDGRIWGLIPAGAGNINSAVTRRSPTRAHPRRCGEHHLSAYFCSYLWGSSPQVRGTCTTFMGRT